MKKQKYITLSDVRKEESLNSQHLTSLEHEIELLRKRQYYLDILEDFLMTNKFLPYVKGNLLIDDFELEKFALPLMLKEKVEYLENQLALKKSCEKESDACYFDEATHIWSNFPFTPPRGFYKPYESKSCKKCFLKLRRK